MLHYNMGFIRVCGVMGLVRSVETKMDGQPRLDGKKFDEGKPELGLVSKSLIWAIGTILTFGAKKYGANNWREGLAWSRPYNAVLRHLTAWWDGESLDAESGKSHLWHAATEIMFLIEYEERGTGHDDRYKHNQSNSQLDINSAIRRGS